MVNLQLFYDISLSLCQVLDGLLAQCGTVENCEQGKIFSFFFYIKTEEQELYM